MCLQWQIEEGRSGWGWFFLSFLTTPILSIILLAILGDSDEKKRRKLIKEEELKWRIAQKYANSNFPQPPLHNTTDEMNDQYRDHSRYMPKK